MKPEHAKPDALAASAAILARQVPDVSVRRVVLDKDGIAQIKNAAEAGTFGPLLHADAPRGDLTSGLTLHGVRYVEEPAQPSARNVAGGADGRFYYADGQIRRAPRVIGASQFGRKIALGFILATVSDHVDADAVGPIIAEALNRMVDAGDVDR